MLGRSATEKKKCSRCVRLTSLPPACTVYLEIWEPQPPGTPKACPGLYWDCFGFLQGPYNNGKYLPNSASHPIKS